MYHKIKRFWDIKPPVYLKHNKRWDGVTVTPIHQEKQVLQTIQDEEEIIVITPVHNRVITRAYGDVLKDEL